MVGIGNRPNQTIAESTRDYLDLFCSVNTPECPAPALKGAAEAFRADCGEIRPGSFVGVALLLLEHYDIMKPILCTMNQTMDSFCVFDMLSTITSGVDDVFDMNFIRNTLNGLDSELRQLGAVFSTGQLCTGCISGFTDNARRMDYFGEKGGAILSTIQAKCGQGFGSE